MPLRWAMRNLCSKTRFYRGGVTADDDLGILSMAHSYISSSCRKPPSKVFDGRESHCYHSNAFHDVRYQIHQERSSVVEEPLDPFSLVADELLILANRLQSMVVAEVPKLASAAEYFFKMGVEEKRFRPTVRTYNADITAVACQVLFILFVYLLCAC